MVRGFERKIHPPSVILKIDIRKVYDSVSWEFIYTTLHKMHFPEKFIGWIMECISSPKFSVLINGSPAGFFKSTRGLQQGDPISPYLFCLAMEVFLCLLEKEVERGNISLIPKCKCINLSHLIFADDLMIFSKVDAISLNSIEGVLHTFSSYSGLHVNRDKSSQIYANISIQDHDLLHGITGFSLGLLPMKYLGVPLIASKLTYQDCALILDHMRKRLAGWKTRPLSYVGKLTLIKSVL